jgi:hypothetical protein
MEYQVPQFIEVEDKIFGPLSLKQFIYIAGGVGLCAILILYLQTLGFILAIPVAAFSGALAFYKLNNKSFVEVLESGFNYFTNGRLYLWKKDVAPHVTKQAPTVPAAIARAKIGLSQSKLHDLAWSLDIKDHQDGGYQ